MTGIFGDREFAREAEAIQARAAKLRAARGALGPISGTTLDATDAVWGGHGLEFASLLSVGLVPQRSAVNVRSDVSGSFQCRSPEEARETHWPTSRRLCRNDQSGSGTLTVLPSMMSS